MSTDMNNLRNYITAMDEHQWDLVPEDMVKCTLTHNYLKAQYWELKFDLHDSVYKVKEKCYRHTGTPPEYQQLYLKDGDTIVAHLAEDARPIGYYSPKNGQVIHIVDSDPHSMARGGGLEDVSKIKKYEMSEEDYDKRKGTLRDFAREKRKVDPSFKFFPKKKPEGYEERPDCESKDCIEHVHVGDRCQIKPGERRGAVAFVGQVEGLASGYWVGVKFDEPVGKGDGTRGGKRYFDAEAKHGAFVRPYNVEVGDFPERDIFADLTDSDEDEAEGAAAGAGAGAEAEAKPAADHGSAATAPEGGDSGSSKPAEGGDASASGSDAAATSSTSMTESKPSDAAAPAPAAAAPAAAADDDDDDEL